MLDLSNKLELAWAAGLLEGEGYFGAYQAGESDGWLRVKLVIECGMTDEDVIDRLHRFFPTANKELHHSNDPTRKTMFRIRLNRKADVLQAIETLYPLMGVRRQARIREMIEAGKRMHGRGHKQGSLL